MMKRIISWLGLIAIATQMGTPIGGLGIATAADPPRGSARDTARVRLGSGEGATDAFVAWPASKGPAPAVIVVHEWWGLNTQIRTVARRLAQEGYVAIVPDLYHGQVADDPELAHELMRGLDEERGLADLEAAAVWLRSQSRVTPGKIGVVGFCMGGRFSELYAMRGKVAAAVMFYGRPETSSTALARLSAPLQGHFGGEDRGIGKDQVEALRAGLAKAGKAGDVYVYAGAGHAFMNDTRDSYHVDAARLAWARTLQFFQKHLKG
jgi:carboxymethylenebutenolidase